jgi:hypothetical protein
VLNIVDDDVYKLRRVHFDETTDVPKAARTLGFTFDRPNSDWVLNDPDSLPLALVLAFECAEEERRRIREQEEARRAEEERQRRAEWEARRAEAEARAEARRAEEERVRSMRERLQQLVDDVEAGTLPGSAFDGLSDEEMAIVREFQREHARKREAELEAMIQAIEEGRVPVNAIDSLNDDERAFVARLAVKSAMSRSKAESTALVSSIAFADASLIDIYYKFMRVIANGFKTLEEKLRNEHERDSSNPPFVSVKDSHTRGLNTTGFDLFGTWAFGHYGLYIRITASSPAIKWRLTVSDAPLNEHTGGAVDKRQNKLIEDEMLETYKYVNPIVRNSGTLIIALSALWNAADDATRQQVANGEVDMSPSIHYRRP